MRLSQLRSNLCGRQVADFCSSGIPSQLLRHLWLTLSAGMAPRQPWRRQKITASSARRLLRDAEWNALKFLQFALADKCRQFAMQSFCRLPKSTSSLANNPSPLLASSWVCSLYIEILIVSCLCKVGSFMVASASHMHRAMVVLTIPDEPSRFVG